MNEIRKRLEELRDKVFAVYYKSSILDDLDAIIRTIPESEGVVGYAVKWNEGEPAGEFIELVDGPEGATRFVQMNSLKDYQVVALLPIPKGV